MSSSARLYSLLAVAVILVLALGDIVFVGLFILPQWRIRAELVSQLTEAEQQIVDARRARENDPDMVRQQLAAAQAELEEAAALLFSESQAAEVLNQLYDCADESGVEILSLQRRPDLVGEEREVYDVKVFRLQVVGSAPGLITFVSRISEAADRSLIISNLNIAEGEKTYNLVIDMILYTSS